MPKWLRSSEEIDRVAKTRCLMLLNVLSGETPVSTAISEAGISRGTYYQLETRALSAMLRALSPGASEEDSEANPRKRIAQLEEKVQKLERGRRRAERLLLMTRRLVKTSEPRLKPRKTSSTRSGSGPSRSSKRKETPVAPHSTPTTTGAGEP